MNSNMNIPGLKEVIIEKIEEIGDHTCLYVSKPRKPHTCLACEETTSLRLFVW